MKKLNLFIIKSYLGPLSMTFFISLFILVMQFLWKYVDDMVGKGLETPVLAELLFYATLQVVPMALPLAILLASLMTFGNLGENYELTAIKAAGISLPRTMKPLIYITIFISIAAFWFSNNVLPYANLKLYSLLYDVKQAKPELEIKEQVFYDGFENFRIKIDHKDKETNLLHNIMIYDHRDRFNKNTNVTLADSGRLQVSADKRNMVLTLLDGVRYDEKQGENNKRLRDRDLQKFRRDVFKEQIALIDLQGMNFDRTDENLFANYDRMKNLNQLTHDIDSFNIQRNEYVQRLTKTSDNFYFQTARYAARRNKQENSALTFIDSAKVENPDTLFASLTIHQKKMALEAALRKARDNKNQMDEEKRHIVAQDSKIRKHTIELHRKFTLSFACFIFFFIGAPLGAIIRKGGLGMPVVISVLFFIVYYIIDTMGAKMAREGIWPVYQGMWLSSTVLLPLGIFLTYKSATDSTLLNADAYIIFFQKLFKREKFDLTNRLDNKEDIKTD
nr:LptF/LptG family permease [uncultured Carboxylicivirga sp.]